MNELVRYYDALIDENNDPVLDPPQLKAEMDKWDGQLFLDALELTGTQEVLEIGVGTGRLAVQICSRCATFCGIDISPKTVTRAWSHLNQFGNARLICGDFMDYTFLRRFDVVYSSLTFLHIANKAAAINKTASLLKKGGRFVLSISKSRDTSINFNGRELELIPDDPQETRRHLEKAGLTPVREFETELAYVFVTEK